MEITEAINERKIINVCQTCRIPIYEREPIYISSAEKNRERTGSIYGGIGEKVSKTPKLAENTGTGGGDYSSIYGGEENVETWTQCAWCYDQWQEELRKDYWFWPKWCSIWFIIGLIITIFYGWKYLGGDNTRYFFSPNWKWTSFSFVTITSGLIYLDFIIILLTIVLGKFFRPQVDRYKIRERKEKL